MKAAIRQRALELGFDDCRFTSADAPASAGQFQNWLAENKNGEMSWLERNAPKRTDPQKVLPGAKSVIVLAASYENSDSRSTIPGSQTGIIARYARFDDYHDVLATRLKLLTQFINEIGGANTRSLWYVDTGPLLERDL